MGRDPVPGGTDHDRRQPVRGRRIDGANRLKQTLHVTLPDVEAVARYRDDARYLFLLNHGDADSDVFADADGVSLLTRAQVKPGERITLAPKDVVILKSHR